MLALLFSSQLQNKEVREVEIIHYSAAVKKTIKPTYLFVHEKFNEQNERTQLARNGARILVGRYYSINRIGNIL
jgi:hypothetical protein